MIQRAIKTMLLILTGMVVQAQQVSSADSALNVKQQSIIPIAANTATGNQDALKPALNDGLDNGLTINEIKEILVQLYAYAGFPRSLNAIGTFQSVLKQRESLGIKDIVGREPAPQNFPDGKYAYGKNVQTRLTGSTATGAAQQFAPAIDIFLKEHLFADIFSRNNLDDQSREIATISALASLGGTEAQLGSHLRVGRNIGFTEAQLRSLAAILSTRVGAKEGNTASRLLDEMFRTNTIAAAALQNTAQNLPTVFAKGKPVNNGNFSGEVFVNMLMPADSVFNTTMGVVTFPAGTRSNWHRHPSGQILLVTDGVGFYQEKGQPIRIVRKGDVIKCLPNIIHWHGASPDSAVSHVAVSPNMQKGSAVWLEKVTDAEYNTMN